MALIAEIQSWSSTFCPSILSSAAPRPTTTSSIKPSALDQAAVTTALSSIAPASSTQVNNPVRFGAGTPGTGLKEVPHNSRANRGPALEAVSIILLCVAAMIVAVRFFARVYTKRVRQAVQGVWHDDWWALAGLILTAGITADIIVGTEYSMGRHLPPDTTAAQLVSILKVVYAFVIIITACFGALKISILFLYLRMTPRKAHRITIYVCMCCVVAHNLSALFVSNDIYLHHFPNML